MTLISTIDSHILLWLEEIRTPIISRLMIIITHLGDAGIFWIACALALLLIKKYRFTGICASLSLAVEFLCNNVILKNIAIRPRPYDVIYNFTYIIEKQSDYSFPSGHAGSSFAVAVVIFMTMPKKYGIPAIIIASLISFSRLYVGVHYPSDVIVGVLLGIVTAIAAVKFIPWITKRIKASRAANKENALTDSADTCDTAESGEFSGNASDTAAEGESISDGDNTEVSCTAKPEVKDPEDEEAHD